eukprot:ANDGO_00721.mRNA.1 Oxysterol-binding protein 9
MSSADFDENDAKAQFADQAGAESERQGSGGYVFRDDNEVKQQRKCMWSFVKTLGSSALQGQDLTKVSLPVRIFEPRSFLERLCDNWILCESFLCKAADPKLDADPIGRFTKTIAFVIGGLHATCHASKPFNPILGETYQAEYANGTIVYAEQTSHHPPVSHFEVYGPKTAPFVFSGCAGWSAAVRGNSVKGQQTGVQTVKFADGTEISWELPYLWLTGIMWGARVLDYCGTVKFSDPKNHLYCELTFNPDAQGYFKSLFFKQKTPTDSFKGDIYKQIDGAEKMVICSVEGSWLTHLDVIYSNNSKERIWDAKTDKESMPTSVANPLPSDCRFREDMKALKEQNFDEAQKWKVVLEEKQRLERKLRAERNKN